MVKVKIYVEGGGESNSLRDECRKGYRLFLEKMGFTGHLPQIIACGTRRHAYDRFCHELGKDDFVILLVDSEAPIEPGTNPWTHVQNRDGDRWGCPNGATEANLHFMVQCLEAWFMADKEKLAKFYGDGFNINSLPARPDIETISKDSLFSGLEQATKNSQKGKYHKGNHSFAILALISPDKVTASSPHAARFIEALKTRCLKPQ